MSTPSPDTADSAAGLSRRGLTAPVVALAAAIALGLGLLAGWAVFAPHYPGDDSVDAGFARDMNEHHAQAVQLSLLVMQRTDNPEVRRLATDIATTQANQQGMMTAWLGEWGLPMARSGERMTWMAGHDHAAMTLPDGVAMPGMASPAEIEQLTASSGRDAEVLYLQLMITHHMSGVDMARAGMDGADDPRVVNLARTMVNGQSSEIDLMSDMLAARGAAPREDVSPYLSSGAPTDPVSPGVDTSPVGTPAQDGHGGH